MSRIVIEYASCRIELDPVVDDTTVERDGNGKIVLSHVDVVYRTDDLVNAFIMVVRAIGERSSDSDAGEMVRFAEQLSKESGRRV